MERDSLLKLACFFFSLVGRTEGRKIMNAIKEGDKVGLLFEAKLENGTLCFKNEKENPLVLVVGEGKFSPTLERELKDMREGETKTVTLEPDEAFGQHIDDLVVEVPKEAFRPDVNLVVGSRVSINATSGKTVYGIVIEAKEDTFTIDFNHPLAGKKIIFTVTVVSIVTIEPTESN
jgi:FKBP-type peptidyl-prolyl cis-trans isomerase 2